MKIGLSILYIAAVVPQVVALFLCGPISFTIVISSLLIAILYIRAIWREELTRRKLAVFLIVALAVCMVSWFLVPRLTFRQAQGRVLALPENAAAEVVTQRWRDWILQSAPDAAKSPLLGAGYFVIVFESGEHRSYFVNPVNGTIYQNPRKIS